MNKVKGFFKRNLPVFMLVFVLILASVTLAAACANLARGKNVAEVSSVPVTIATTTTPVTTTPVPTTTTPATTPAVTTPVPTTVTAAPATTAPAPTTPATTKATTKPQPTTTGVPATVDDLKGVKEATLMVVSSSANIRKTASLQGEILGVVKNGGKIEAINPTKDANGKYWFVVKYKGQYGYVSMDVVKILKTGAGTAYLTFDDGPSKVTTSILDTLDQNGVKATFFVKYNKGFESMYKKIVDRGHTIANHTYSHEYSTIYASEDGFFADLGKMENFIKAQTGVTTKIIRFPGGSSNTVSKRYNKGVMTRLTKDVTAKGYVYFDWNVDSGDATAVTVKKDKLVANIKSNLGTIQNAVILMHDASPKTTTAEALPEIIDYLRRRGYDIKPLTVDSPPMHHGINN